VEYERVPEPLRWIYVDTECFVQVFPPPEPGAAARTGLLDDLDRPDLLGSPAAR
jgi:hypothetical protein